MPTTTVKAKHTPGPWTECHDADGDYTIFSVASSKIIAITDLDRDEDRANARLIAAAPQMLATLEHIESLDPKGIGCREGCGCYGCIARAAIREARGE